jgi:hypothetical protein
MHLYVYLFTWNVLRIESYNKRCKKSAKNTGVFFFVLQKLDCVPLRNQGKKERN